MAIDDGRDHMPPALPREEAYFTLAGAPPAAGALAPTLADLPAGHPEVEPTDWLARTLQAAMEELMAAEIPPLARANAIARLGSLFLRAARAAELQRANKVLHARVNELEERLAALKAAGSETRTEPTSPPTRSFTTRSMPAGEQPSSDETALGVPSPDLLAPPHAPAAEPHAIVSHGERVPGAATVCPVSTPAFAFTGARGSP